MKQEQDMATITKQQQTMEQNDKRNENWQHGGSIKEKEGGDGRRLGEGGEGDNGCGNDIIRGKNLDNDRQRCKGLRGETNHEAASRNTMREKKKDEETWRRGLWRADSWAIRSTWPHW